MNYCQATRQIATEVLLCAEPTPTQVKTLKVIFNLLIMTNTPAHGLSADELELVAFQFRVLQTTSFTMADLSELVDSSTSILKVLLKQYMSPTGPNKYLRGIKPTKSDQLKLDLFKIKIWKNCIEKSGKLNFRKG